MSTRSPLPSRDGALTDAETINITVNEVNVAPVLGAIGDQTVDELVELAFTATATDADLPANTLTFSLDAAHRLAGMTIHQYRCLHLDPDRRPRGPASIRPRSPFRMVL